MTVEETGAEPIEAILINASPRPRLLVWGLEERKSIVESMLALAPTSKYIRNISEVRQLEWDVLVTDKCITDAQAHLFVLYIAPESAEMVRVDDLNEPPGRVWNDALKFGQISVAQELKRIRKLPERVAELSKEQLEPIVKARPRHRIFFWWAKPTRHSQHLELPKIQPFIATADNEILAGRYKREGGSEVWLFPPDTPDTAVWLRTAMAEWRHIAPERFPGLANWTTEDEWMTPSERAAQKTIMKLEAEHEEAIRCYEERRLELKNQLAKAHEEGNAYERALLTTQSDELKVTVSRALSEIGFVVRDADESNAPDDHLEDLQVFDPAAPEWIALVEVKGYTKGAKTEALTQFLRFNKRYVMHHGKTPDAEWYVVNHFLARDPYSRQPVLHGKEEDVQAFAQGGGLVIDTVTLFKLLMDVRSGRTDVEAIRAHMRESVGHLIQPSP